MTDWITWWTQALWRNGLAVVPMALIVWAIVRWGVRRPATRHALWLGALIWLFAAVLLPPMALRTIDEADDDDAAAAATPSLVMDSRPMIAESKSARFESRSTADCDGDFESAAVLSRQTDGMTRLCEPADDTNATASPVETTVYADSRVLDEIEAVPTLDVIELSDEPAPTPPMTIVRPDGHAPSLPVAAHDSVGQSSPLFTAIEPGCGSVSPTSVSEIQTASALDRVSEACVPDETTSRAAVPAGCERIGIVGIPPRAGGALPMAVRESARRSIRQWFGAWIRLRDSIGAMPAIPASLWLGVAILLVAVKAIATLRFQLRLRSAKRAPRGVRAMVRACASSIGLKTPPETIFVNDRVSPMVVCGWRPRLVLPIALWSELDPAGRRAVIVHELAHLRRRDHLTHWFDCLIGVVYWWHPIVWWVRHRLRDEAENACDAWVTWLDPRERRAYATALLQARTFLSEQGRFSPVPAVGVMSPQATRFSRRLTMVMTSRVSPRAFSMGIFAMPILFLAAWVSMPASSAACPPEDKSEAEPVKFIHAAPVDDAAVASEAIVIESGDHRIQTGEVVFADPSSGRIITLNPAVSHDGVVLTVAGDDHAHAHAGWDTLVEVGDVHPAHDADARLDRLERQMAELSEKLSVLIEQRNTSRSGPRFPAPVARTPSPIPPVASGSRVRSAPSVFSAVPMANGIVVRTYQLPDEKLAALTKLMSRSDVPTRVRSVPGGIEVHANEADQAKFAAFVEMISGNGMDDTKTYSISKGKLEALTELMALDDVPVMVHPGDDEIGVQGGGLIQKTFRDFLSLIEPTATSSSGIGIGSVASTAPGAAAALGDYTEALRAYELAAQAAPNAASLRKLMGRSASSRARAAELEAQAAKLEAEADRLAEQAERMREKAEEMESRLDRASSDKERSELEAAVADLHAGAAKIERQLESVYQRAEELESRADEIEDLEKTAGR
ncbi:MAG: hypothetical protein H6819_11370 [Phycisphaerales bacterium]|nr:hypothetical protein [Phycisphaerales bacterium]MCB9855015.1 hypothetical protein [Phycisphaerales bacterium]MCB9863468.1 hypothetical protein [Phycisphaerales bacterium]